MTENANTSPRNDNVVVCHVCGNRNLLGALICDNCGAMLSSGDSRSRTGTRNLNEELPEFQTNPVFISSNKGEFKEGMRLKIEVVGQKEPVEIDPSRRDVLMGRRDQVSRRKPDVDLEDFEGYRLGVSRKHALISLRNTELTLQDYGSANGTYLNGVRLPAHQAHKLHDGDVIQLGHLTLRIYFLGG